MLPNDLTTNELREIINNLGYRIDILESDLGESIEKVKRYEEALDKICSLCLAEIDE